MYVCEGEGLQGAKRKKGTEKRNEKKRMGVDMLKADRERSAPQEQKANISLAVSSFF
jgi:hypothetical protein